MKHITGMTAGAFDFLHTGHIIMLKEAKEQCDYLIVMLQTDPTIDRPKKNRPIQSLYERWTQLQAVKYVDQIITYQTEEDLVMFIKHIKPTVRIIGADWSTRDYTGKKECEQMGIEIYFNSRNHNFSSTNLRKRIKDAKLKS